MTAAVEILLTLEPFTGVGAELWEGQGLRATMAVRDVTTGAPVAATGVRMLVRLGEAAVPTEYPVEELTEAGTGRWQLDVVPDAGGYLWVRAECTAPRQAAAEKRVRVRSSKVLQPVPPEVLIATPEGEVIGTPQGAAITARRADRLPALGDALDGDKVVVVRGEVAGQMQWQNLAGPARTAGAEAARPFAEAAAGSAQAAAAERAQAFAARDAAQNSAALVQGNELTTAAASAQAVLAATQALQSAANALQSALAAAGLLQFPVRTATTLTALAAITPAPSANTFGQVLGTGTDRGTYLFNGTAWAFFSPLLPDVSAVANRLLAALGPVNVPGVIGVEAFADHDIATYIDPLDGVVKMLGLSRKDDEVPLPGISAVLSYADEELLTYWDPYDWTQRPIGVSADPRFRLDGVLSEIQYDDQTLLTRLDEDTGLVALLGVNPRDLIQQIAGTGGGGGTSGPDYGDYTAADVALVQERAVAESSRIRRRIVKLAQPDADINLIVGIKQSNMEGAEAHPCQDPDVELAPGLVMLGPSVHPMVLNGTVWAPMNGDRTIRPLRGTVTATFEGGGILNAEQIAALPFKATNRGQYPGQTAAAVFQQARLAMGGSPNRLIGVSNCAVGGTGNPQWDPALGTASLLNRFRTCLQEWKAAGIAAGKTVKVIAIQSNGGETGPFTNYEQLERAILTAARAIAVEVLGEWQGTDTIGIYIGQTGGTYTTTSNNMVQAVAHLAVANSMDGVFVTRNNGAFQDKDDHLAATGQAWAGCQDGKVMVETILNGRGWQLTQPVAWYAKGTTLLIGYHAPTPPMRWSAHVAGFAYVSRPDSGGIYVEDLAGPVGVSGARWVADNVLLARLDRSLGEGRWGWIGRRNGSDPAAIYCSDSGPEVSPPPIIYRYVPGSGQVVAENNPDFVNLAYPLNNLSAATRMPIALGI